VGSRELGIHPTYARRIKNGRALVSDTALERLLEGLRRCCRFYLASWVKSPRAKMYEGGDGQPVARSAGRVDAMPLEKRAEYSCAGSTLELAIGDITEAECGAVVNPANSLMIMGGGVAGALRRAAGLEVEHEARRRAPVPVGRAVTTGAGRLEPRVRYIIHAPTMERPAMRTTPEKVEAAAYAALKEASRLGVDCVAFPAMGAGVGGLDAEESMSAMLRALDRAVGEGLQLPERIVFVAYREADLRHFQRALERARLRHCRLVKKEASG